MAAPMKNGLDYFPFEVSFFSDKKIKRLRAKHGNDGVCVLIYLYTEIYREGYYIAYDDDLILDIADELNISENSTRQIVAYLLSRSMLDSTLAESVKVLTAKSIQRRFQEAKRGLKRDVFVEARCWLLNPAETLSFIKMRPDDSKSEKNSNKSEINPDKSQIYSTKESKVKESKVKERNNKPASGLSGIIEGYTQNDDLRAALGEFVKMRKTLRKPLTENALNLQLKELNKLGGNDSVKLAVVNQSVMNSWQGFYPLKKEAAHKAQRQEENKNASYDLDDWNKMIQSQQSDDFDYSQMFKGGG